jgi:YihY family inner membrane protein
VRVKALDRVMDRVDGFQQRHRFSAIAVAVLKKYGDDNGRTLAATIAFYGFFSVFPLMLVLVSVVGIVLRGNDELRQRILNTALAQFPVIGNDIKENVGAASGSIPTVVVGVIGALWAGTAAFTTLQLALNLVWGVPRVERGSQFARRLRAVVGVALVGAGLLGLTIVTSVLAGVRGGPLGVVGRIVLVAATVALVMALFAAVFRLLTRAEIAWRAVLPGAAMAGVGWVLLGAVGGIYINRVVQGASDTYGVFAVVIGLLSWLLLLAHLVIYAAELNAVLAQRCWPRSLRDGKLTKSSAALKATPELADAESGDR